MTNDGQSSSVTLTCTFIDFQRHPADPWSPSHGGSAGSNPVGGTHHHGSQARSMRVGEPCCFRGPGPLLVRPYRWTDAEVFLRQRLLTASLRCSEMGSLRTRSSPRLMARARTAGNHTSPRSRSRSGMFGPVGPEAFCTVGVRDRSSHLTLPSHQSPSCPISARTACVNGSDCVHGNGRGGLLPGRL